MRKIKKIPKYVTVDVPDTDHDLIKKIGEITSDNKHNELYFYTVKYNTFKSNIPKFILELISVYELYVKNTYLNTCMRITPVYYDTYQNKVSGFKYHYSIYTNFMSTFSFINEIRRICNIANKRKVLYNIYNIKGSISTPNAITAIHELVKIYLESRCNKNEYNKRIYFNEINESITITANNFKNIFKGERDHPTN